MNLTREEVESALPANLKGAATQEFTDKVNQIVSDPEEAELVRNNFVSYTSVLKEGKFRTEDYLNAVTYVSFKLMGYNSFDSYVKTFEDRYTAMVAAGKSRKEISSYVTHYNRNQLVNLILEQSLVPSWVLNQDAFQKAINTQVDIMTNSNSDIARTQAANSLMTHLKRPEPKNLQLQVNVSESQAMLDLKSALSELAKKQIDAIESGTPTKLIAGSAIVDAEFTEVGPDQTGAG